MSQNLSSQNQQTLVFFDGQCVLCNGFVDWLMLRDSEKRLLFASLQGTTALELVPQEKRLEMSTVLAFHNGLIFEKSEAILWVVSQLTGYGWVTIFKYLPKTLRDAAYTIVATNRSRLFGMRSSACRLPSEMEKGRILP